MTSRRQSSQKSSRDNTGKKIVNINIANKNNGMIILNKKTPIPGFLSPSANTENLNYV